MSEGEPIVPAPSEGSQIVQASEDRAAGPLPASVALPSRHSAGRESSPYANKFRAVTAALVGLAIAAIVIAVAVGTHSSKSTSTQAWSDWRPDQTGALGAREIADHLAPLYRISAVDQLAVVTVVNLSDPAVVTGSSGTTSSTGGLAVAVQTGSSATSVSLLSGNTMAYNLCGIGATNCAIGVGQPSAARLLLLKREALELALYTFKYIGDVDNVVALLPPGYQQAVSTKAAAKPAKASGKPSAKSAKTSATATNASAKAGKAKASAAGGSAAASSSAGSSTGKPVDLALLFVHSELKPWLDQPLSNTLPEELPPTVQEMASAPEAGLVDQITARGLFTQKLVQAQDGSDLIVLDPLPPQ